MVLKMITVFPQGLSYDLFFDRFFTSLPLLATQLGHFGTGTIKVNRLGNRHLDLKDLKKKKIGCYG